MVTYICIVYIHYTYTKQLGDINCNFKFGHESRNTLYSVTVHVYMLVFPCFYPLENKCVNKAKVVNLLRFLRNVVLKLMSWCQ